MDDCKTKCLQMVKKCTIFLSAIIVEPVGFLIFSSYLLADTVLPEAQKIKMLDMYANELPENATEKMRENLVQDKIVHWNMYTSAASIPIAAVVTVLLGALGDKYGRQVNMLLGIISQMFIILGRFLAFTEAVKLPFWPVSIIFMLLAACCGDYYITYVSSQAFMADVVKDKPLLTIRMTILSIARSLGAFFGSQMAGWWGDDLGFDKTMMIAICLGTTAFFYTLVRIPQIPPSELETKQNDNNSINSIATDSEAVKEEVQPMWKKVLRLLKDTKDAFLRPRAGHKRMFLLVCASVQFVTMLSLMDLIKLVGIYTLRSPLSWGPAELGKWISTGIIMSSIGSTIGILLLKKVLGLSDTAIIVIGLFSQSLSPIPIAFATDDWMMYLSSGVSILSGITQPTLASFVSTLVFEYELGKIYTSFAMASFVASLIQLFVLQQVYLWSLNFYPGFVWLVSSFLSVCCAFAMGLVHVMAKHESDSVPYDIVDD